MSNAARRSVSVGAAVNLVSVDLEKIPFMLRQLNYAWAAPVMVAVSVALMWQQIGASSLAGLGLLLLLLPLNAISIARKLKRTQVQQ